MIPPMDNDARFRGAGLRAAWGSSCSAWSWPPAAATCSPIRSGDGGYWCLWGHNAFGLTLVPFLFGVGILFFNGRSRWAGC